MSGDKINCLLLGGGGHGKVVLEAILAAPGVERVGILDPRAGARGSSRSGSPTTSRRWRTRCGAPPSRGTSSSARDPR